MQVILHWNTLITHNFHQKLTITLARTERNFVTRFRLAMVFGNIPDRNEVMLLAGRSSVFSLLSFYRQDSCVPYVDRYTTLVYDNFMTCKMVRYEYFNLSFILITMDHWSLKYEILYKV